MIKICFLDTLGLKYTGNTLQSRGLGGSESAVIFMSRELVKLGFDVTVFNCCEQEGIYDGVKYLDKIKAKDTTETFDILISSRSCVPYIPIQYRETILNSEGYDIADTYALVRNSNYKILWLHDTFCAGDNWLENICVDGYFNEIFTLSDFHTSYITTGSFITNPETHVLEKTRSFEVLKNKIWQTRNGINNYIDEVNINAKDKNLFVYNSSITKGMVPLLEDCWEKIKEKIPDAKLIIIGGYYRGANKGNPDKSELDFYNLMKKYDGKIGITFTDIIKQNEIAKILERASFLIYPSLFPETYGISTLEAINYNVLPITCKFGALEEVAQERVSYLLNYNIKYRLFQINLFVDLVIKAYNDNLLKQQKMYACNEFKPYITWDTVALQWKQHFYNIFNLPISFEELKKVKKINKEVQRIFGRKFLNKEDIIESYIENGNQKKIVIISPMYNAEKYIDKCIKSVANQFYRNYKMFIIDDLSTDNSYDIAQKTIESLPLDICSKFILVKNTEKKYALGNQVEIIDAYVENDDIIILLDGDDWLINDSDIFNYINFIYEDGIEMSYGSFHSLATNMDWIAQPYPKNIHAEKSYRKYLFPWNIPYTHLRTFKKSLFNKIDKSLFKDENNEYWKAGGDNALFYSLLENSSGEKIKCIQKVLSVYNDINPNCDMYVNSEEQNRNAAKIINNKKNDIGNALFQIYDDVINRNTDAINSYKYIIKNRQDVWLDDTESIYIKPRKNWIINKLKELKVPFSAKILDIGSWTGKLCEDIASEGYDDITCIDINEECIKKGKENFPFFNWIQGDIEEIKLDEKYDIIIMGEVIEHLVNPFKTIDKMKNILTDRGIILYTIPTEETVFGETKGAAMEHISKITKEDLLKYTNNIETIKSDGYFNWNAGIIEKELNIQQSHNIDFLEEKNILIAIPSSRVSGDDVKFSTMLSISKMLCNIINNKINIGNIKVLNSFTYGIAQTRNLIMKYALANNFDYILTIDGDIIIDENVLIKLLSHKKDIVGTVYRQRNENENIPEVYINDKGKIRRPTPFEVINKGLIEVYSIGMGCTLISKKVIKEIGYPWFVYHEAIEWEKTISEDFDFCMKAKAKGFNIYLDTNIQCKHLIEKELIL